MTKVSDESEEPKCRCGFDRSSGLIRRTPKYTLMGWITLLWGVSVTPKRIDYQCMKCEEVIFTEKSDRVLNREA